MTRWIAIATALALALGALSAGIAIAAGDGGSEPSGATPSTVSDDAQQSEAPQGDDDAAVKDGDEAGSSEDDGAVAEADAAKASEAALATTGGGTVANVESDDNGAGYEVEVRKGDGSEVEVQLGNDFQPRADEAEGETEDESGGNEADDESTGNESDAGGDEAEGDDD